MEEKLHEQELLAELRKSTKDVMSDDDWDNLKSVLSEAISANMLKRDDFGLNTILVCLETIKILQEEIGITRASILGVMLYPLLLSDFMSMERIKAEFGEDLQRILHGLLRIRDLYAKSATVESDNFRNLLLTSAEDMRVILILIANTLCIMRHIKGTDNVQGQKRISTEAASLYAPLAHKLGLYKIKSELEDLSVKYLEHDAYYLIKEKLNATKKSRDEYIARFIKPIEEKLKNAGLKFHMKGRTKSIHSILQKMKKQGVGFEGVYDLFAIRVILDSEMEKEKMECWQVFSIITDMYQSNPKRMRDWLSVPKSNGYESLHITVLGPEEKWVEVQIRTERMDDIAEHGLAAHWRYKGIKGGQSGVDEWLANVRSALEANDEVQLTDQFKLNLMEDEVFVFTPKGDLFKLPIGATILDFAYAIHTKVGNQCIGAKIGDKHVTIRQKLQSGDQVEIMTSSNQTPKRDWLKIVTTNRAKAKIRQSLKEMQSKQSIVAKEELERKMKNKKLEYDEATLMHTITRLGYKIVTDFYAALANGVLEINNVLEAYANQLRHDRGEEERTAPTQSADQFVMQSETDNKTYGNGDDVMVIGQDVKGLDFKMAKCCQPVYGDDVFGFVTNGGGIKIHRVDCPNAPQMKERFPYRIVRAKWAGKRGSQYPITLKVIGNDDLGIVNNITSIISKEEKILLRSISIDSNDGLFSGTLTVMVDDTAKLQQLIKKMKTVKGVKNVTRS